VLYGLDTCPYRPTENGARIAIAIQVERRVDRHFLVVANYTHFFAGQFIRETGPSKDTDYTTAWLQ
jgi:hypothetical protein